MKQKTFNYKKKHFPKVFIGKKYECYFIFVPLVPIIMLGKYCDNKQQWNKAKAQKVLDKALPKVLEYIKADKAYYFSNKWNIQFYNFVPFYLKQWTHKFNKQLHTYLYQEYENTNYNKSFLNDNFGEWIKFTEKK